MVHFYAHDRYPGGLRLARFDKRSIGAVIKDLDRRGIHFGA